MSIHNDLTGLRWLRKYFKGRDGHAYLGLGPWAVYARLQPIAIKALRQCIPGATTAAVHDQVSLFL